ncbi:MAG: efflux RND transporter periplasmic adaptor subunit [Flavobacteriaceae bacterium]|nr:efflux RND transporter periplasmic adaptor subunit [Flavobacteriaceae bacterium]
MKYILIVLAFLAMSCNHKTEDAHAHNADGSHLGEEIPRLSNTLWTDKTELFVEYPALIVGNVSRFAAHFTILNKHQPVREGAVTVSLIKNNKGIRNTVDAPSSPGIFSPSLQPKEAGSYQLIFELTTPEYSDKIIIDNVTVYANVEEAIKALGTAEDDGNIAFLKEQAWKIDFQTEPVIKGKIYDNINTSGVWMPSPGSAKSIVANSNGVVEFAINNLIEGSSVKKGQLLMNISSNGLATNNLQTEIANAKASYQQVKLEYERKKQLYESKIVAKAEFEIVESKFLIAKSTYESLTAGVSNVGKQIRAPFDGYIKSISVSNGDYVEQGVALLAIGTSKSRMLEVQVSPSYRLTMDNVQGIWYKTNMGDWVNVNDNGGSIVSIGKDVEHEKPFVSLYAAVNKMVEMPDGSIAEVQIAIGNANQNTMIPINALLEDYGTFSVIVQLSGESFERRAVKIGRRNGEYAEVLQGLTVDEVVVTKGAYQVKMASMSGSTPAHGHAH